MKIQNKIIDEIEKNREMDLYCSAYSTTYKWQGHTLHYKKTET